MVIYINKRIIISRRKSKIIKEEDYLEKRIKNLGFI